MPPSQTETTSTRAANMDSLGPSRDRDAGAPLAEVGRGLGWLLLLGGLVGTAAAFVLTVEKIALLTDPAFVPSCNLNPVLNCGSIMRTEQAEVFGFPNPLLGLVGFPVLATTGAALLAGARLRAWYWLGLQTGVTLGLVFVGWLVYQSLYRIGALCPYCMAVWAVVIPAFWYITLANLRMGRLPGAESRLVRTLQANHAVVLVVVLLGIVGLATHRFWDYWVSVVS